MEEQDGPIVLYDFFASNCAWRVRNVLHYKGIPYETKSIHLQKGEQHHPDFLRDINPYGAVPVLFIDGVLITQSIAICEYLEETRPYPSIFPSDPYQRAQVRRIVELINSYLVPLQNPTTAKKYSKDPQEQQAWSMDFFTKGFVVLEKLLEETSGRHAVGDAVTFADCSIVPQVWRAKRLTRDFTRYPNIVRINENALTIPSFQTAHAEAHADCPADMKGKFC